jgi:hypothetical protein
MSMESERAKILEMIEEGSITAEQGLRLLNALGGGDLPEIEDRVEEVPSPLPDPITGIEAGGALEELPIKSEVELPLEPLPPEIEEVQPLEYGETPFGEPPLVEDAVVIEEASPEMPDPEELNKWKHWWFIPFWVGVGITIVGGLLMYWAYSASGFGFWFACAWFPFLLGVAVLALAWGSRSVPWVHVRVHQRPGETPERIAISIPIPVRLTAWGFRTFGHFIPNVDASGLDAIVLALNDIADSDTPLYVDVDDGEDGEHVQVFIG